MKWLLLLPVLAVVATGCAHQENYPAQMAAYRRISERLYAEHQAGRLPRREYEQQLREVRQMERQLAEEHSRVQRERAVAEGFLQDEYLKPSSVGATESHAAPHKVPPAGRRYSE